MDLIVETKYGKIEGFTEKNINKWYGIPYAKPPVGELRFRRSVPCDAWEGVKPCKTFGNKSVQFMTFLYNKSSTSESEDCLTLNIWRKNSKDKQLPVYVWIHGGYLHCGSGCIPSLDGTHFAEEDVIYVSINYRLGPLGCYDFSLYNPDRFDSNCALSDQILALTWIKENIEAFGGDPNNITIAGQSTGASSVCALLASPKTKGLFQKVISQSSFTDGYNTRKDMKMLMDLYLKLLDITPENVDTVATLDINRLKKATNQLFKEHERVYPGSLMPGIMYDDLFPENCSECIKKEYSKGIKLMIGTCEKEGSLFYLIGNYPNSWDKVKQYCDICHFHKDFSEVEKVYEYVKSEKQKIIDVNTDVLFTVSSIKVADSQSAVDDVWMYQLNYAPRILRWTGLNATHGAEIALTNKNTDKDLLYFMTSSGPKNKLTQEMFGSWVSFAKTGNPNGKHLSITWEKYDATHRKTIFFDEITEMVENPAKEKYELWKDIKYDPPYQEE
ncbi:hypothetical protein PIROE2DRAFT_11505 [Piromyces sp. E2]|nr:hypothetical protein PIROE2DRAFT_11505 [Piromyces sp. E2]|eukprot:OUM62249.1 hypothetical protein PIROE2DRAFT_11505 [Piromyces sp. E2]